MTTDIKDHTAGFAFALNESIVVGTGWTDDGWPGTGQHSSVEMGFNGKGKRCFL